MIAGGACDTDVPPVSLPQNKEQADRVPEAMEALVRVVGPGDRLPP